MIFEIAIRYLHFLSIITLAAAVVAQHWGLRKQLKRSEIHRLHRMDIVYAVSVVLVLATGFIQWFAVGKPAEFYSKNGLFHAKITLFLVIGLLSIYPSVFFGRRRKGDPGEIVTVPPLVAWSLRAELLLLVAMPLLATLMARGVGYSPE